MKLALLSNENNELLQELKREYISDSYENYLQLIVSDICQELGINVSVITDTAFYKELSQLTIVIINKIWLDNLMKYITNSKIDLFTSLIERCMLGQDTFVNVFYARQITDILPKYFNINSEELDTVTDVLVMRLYYIMNMMYCNNTMRYNEILLQLLHNLFLTVRNIQFRYYKFELDSYFRPLILYTEKEPNETFYTF